MLTGLGALQLVLDNGDRLLRLEVASQLAASLTEETGGIVTQHKLLAILNAPPFDSLEIGAQEDPHPDLFVDCLTLPSGSWRVFTGISDGYPFIVEHLGLALWHIAEVRHRPWAEEGRHIITAALRISDRVAEKAGLQRGTRVGEPHRAAVGATRAGEFERLRAAVRFSMAEVNDILHDIEDPEPTLARLLTRPGEHPFDGGLETFAGFPLCRCGDSLVVHLPHLILPALRHAVVSMAVKAGDAGAIAVAYARAVWDTCCRSLGRLGNEYETAIDLGPLAGRGARAATFSLDVDKKLCAILLPDHLDAYDANNVFQPSSEPDVTKPFQEAVALCGAALKGEQPLFLFIHQGIGRDTQLDMGELAGGPAVFFNGDHLRVVSWIAEHRDPLALWYFAVANERASKAGVRGHSSFDMYAFYRKHKHSFYFGDEAAPGWAMLQPGFGRELREHLQERCDWHGARRPSDPVFHNLTSWQSQANTWPLYTPMLSIGEQVWVLVEGLRVPVWVVGTKERNARLYHHYAVLAETVAYWIWQSTPELNDILSESVANAPWTVWLYLRSSDTWDTGRFPDQYRLPAVEVDVRPAQGSMCLFVEPALATLALRDDNVADRQLLAALLERIRLNRCVSCPSACMAPRPRGAPRE